MNSITVRFNKFLSFIFYVIIPIYCIAGVNTCFAQQNAYFRINAGTTQSADFDKRVDRMIKAAGIPAISLAVMDNGRVVYEKSYGVKQMSTNVKVNDSTVFEACSLSKSFLCYLAYKLADEGKLDLDRPIHQYLEPGPMLDYDPRYKMITARMILSHSSGMENGVVENKPDSMEILNNPGDMFHYSSLGYNYLAGAIETLLKEPYDTYMPRLVLQPLQLRNTFTRYIKNVDASKTGEKPDNYAIGHSIFDHEFSKWKIYEGIPSSGISTTAGDDARLILYITDGKHLTAKSAKQVSIPVIRTSIDSSEYYYGTGFEILITEKDTIIGHGGSNEGFKAQMFYSIVNKRGFVFLTNSDQGKLITSQLNAMTAKLDITDYYRQFSVDQFPSESVSLLQLYKRKGTAAMFKGIATLEKQGSLKENTLNQLGKYFRSQDTVVARKLFEKNITLFPRSAYAFILRGDLYKDLEQYAQAISCYDKARELGFKLWDIEPDVQYCRNKIVELEKRSRQLFEINDQMLVQAESYNAMKGVRLEGTSDSAGGANIGYADPGDWMEYRILIATTGEYKMTFRLANDRPGSSFELLSGDEFLANLQVRPTNGWQQWESQEIQVRLKSGYQTLRIKFLSGATNINWLQLTRLNISP
jgi:CubicO group peptidase (beta-lactamase class C family)